MLLSLTSNIRLGLAGTLTYLFQAPAREKENFVRWKHECTHQKKKLFFTFSLMRLSSQLEHLSLKASQIFLSIFKHAWVKYLRLLHAKVKLFPLSSNIRLGLAGTLSYLFWAPVTKKKALLDGHTNVHMAKKNFFWIFKSCPLQVS
jgi:hypothetical protein